tara:strand:+ start:17142 stop:17624 length:483 start_codon:yes stop_codon:yes gene_type:complete
MKNSVILFVLISLLCSCTSNTVYEKPKDLIPKDSMILLLKDLYIASSARSIKNKKLQRKITYIPLVYDTYKIDSLRFHKSNVYYTSKVDDYQPILEEVMVLLEKEQATFAKIKKVKDSIRKDSLESIKEKIIEKNKTKIIKSKKTKFSIDDTQKASKKSN